jgi:acetyl esterase
MRHSGGVTHDFTLSPANRALRRVLSLPAPWIERIAGGPPPRIDGRTLAPPVHLIVRSLDRFDITGSGEDVRKRRTEMRRSARLVMPVARGVRVTDTAVPGPVAPVPVRVYRSHRAVGPVPVIVYYHGGGWVVGDLDSHDGTCRMLATHSGCAVVSVDYRLAPESPFPAALDDALAAFRYVHEHPRQFTGIPGAVAVMGDSAGGTLAASVALLTREQGPTPVAQALVYPATDLTMSAPSIDTFATGFLLTKADMLWYRGHYLTDPALTRDPRVSPLLTADLVGAPPATIYTAGFDPLRDEGMAYANRLREAGIQVSDTCFDDQVHGFFGMGVVPGGMERIEQVCREVGDLVYRSSAARAG